MKKDGRFDAQRPYKLAHQVLCITAFNFHRQSLIGYVELTIQPLRTDLRRIKLNSKQCRLYRVSINDRSDATFWYNDPTQEVVQDEVQANQKSVDVFEKLHCAALNTVNAEFGNGEVTIKIPPDLHPLVAELQPLRVNVEFSLEQPEGGLHFVVPNIEGSLAERGAHLFSYRHDNMCRLWFPCVDSYSEPCTWKLEYTCDLDMTAVSCGDLLEVVYTSDRRQKTYHYFQSTPTAAPNIALAVGPFEMLVDPYMHEVTHFCLPHLKGILKHTTRYLHEAFEFYEELMSSRYPYSCYKQVFVDESYEEMQAFATMSIFSTNLLHSARVIDQVMVTRTLMASAVAQQFFGCFIAMQSWCDAWLPKGISAYLTQVFVKKTFGNNEYRHNIAKYLSEVQEYEAKYGGIVLDPSTKDTAQYFSTLQPHTIPPSFLAMYDKKALLIVRMLESRIGPTLLLQVFNKLLALAYSASQQKFVSNSAWYNMLLSTQSFLKIISTVTGKDILPFIEQWVSQSGCARFIGSFVFNRKRNVVELEIKQDSAAKGALKYVGPLEVTIQELDGSFNHTFNIEENKTKFEITCHSKSRRNKKKKIPLMTGEEVDMDLNAMDADSPVLWLRSDPGMNLLRSITWEQPDYMWQYQLKYERDVVAQSEAIVALRSFATPATRKALTDVLESEQCYYKVRIEASMCLAKVANTMVASWAGPPAMMTIFRKMFGSHSCPSIIRQNNFNNFQHYFILKAVPLAMAQLRNLHNICPPEVVKFLLDLFKYNDNSKNKYSDNYYRAAIIDALAATVTPAVTTVTITGQSVNSDLSTDTKSILEEITRCLNLEKLLSCYRHTVTVSCLRVIRTLQKFGHLPSDPAIFRSYSQHGVFRDVRVVAIEALADFIKTDVNVAELHWLLDLVENDPDKYIRHAILQLLCENPPFRRGEDSLLNTEALVMKLWKLMNTILSQDSRLRCGITHLYFILFGKYRPSCLHVPDSFTVFAVKEKKPMINPAVVSEQMTDMFEDDDDDDNLPQVLPPSQTISVQEEVIVDIEGNPSETESPMAGTKRKIEEPSYSMGVPKVIAMSDFTHRPEVSASQDSSSFKLKIKIGNRGDSDDSKPVIRQVTTSHTPVTMTTPSLFGNEFPKFARGPSLDESASHMLTPIRTPSVKSEAPIRTPSVKGEAPIRFPVSQDSQSHLSEDSNSSQEDSSLSRPGPPSAPVKSETLTSFHGLFSSASTHHSTSTPLTSTPVHGLFSTTSTQHSTTSTAGASNAVADDSDVSRLHKLKKRKKNKKHKHKHKHKHDRQEKEWSGERGERDHVRDKSESLSISSPMVPSVQSVASVTSMSSLDNIQDSGPSSPEFEVI